MGVTKHKIKMNLHSTKNQVVKIIKLHKLWLKNKNEGKKACFDNMDLSGLPISDLESSEINLDKVSFKNVKMIDSYLPHQEFTNCDFTGANLKEISFTRGNLSGSIFTKVNLMDSSMMEVNF